MFTSGSSYPFRAGAWSLICALTLSPVAPAFARQSEPSPENVAAARALASEGIQLADAGNCAKAVERLERADQLFHAPTVLGRLAECQVKLGQLVRGTENLNKVVRETLPTNAPQVYRDAQARAKKLLDATLPRLPMLTIRVEPPSVAATVTVDGVPVPQALIGVPRPTDPGNHEVTALAQGYLPTRSAVQLLEAGRGEVVLTLQPDPNALVAQKPQPDANPPGITPGVEPGPAVNLDQKPAPSTEPHSKRSNVVPFVLLGLGGVGLATGGVFGLMAISSKNKLTCDPNTKSCTKDQQPELNKANNQATAATIGFVAGGAVAAAGLVWLLVNSSHNREVDAGTQGQFKLGPVTATPWVGPFGAGLDGTF